MNKGFSTERFPWFGRPEGSLVRHNHVRKNYGLAGGWLNCTFWASPSGDPTGITVTRHLEFEPVANSANLGPVRTG